MSTQPTTLDAALGRLIALANDTAGAQPSTTEAPPLASATPPVVSPASAPAADDDTRRRLAERAAAARQYLYLSTVPVVNTSRAKSLESVVPQIVARIGALGHRPSRRRAMTHGVANARAHTRARLRDESAAKSTEALLHMMLEDYGLTSTEREFVVGAIVFFGAAALLVSAFSVGYTIGKDIANNQDASDAQQTTPPPSDSTPDRQFKPSDEPRPEGVPDWMPWPPPISVPWPWPVPRTLRSASGERAAGVAAGYGDVTEMAEAVYLRPDVQAATIEASQALAALLADDPRAYETLRDLCGHDEFVERATGGEREPVTISAGLAIGVAATIIIVGGGLGGLVGYLVNRDGDDAAGKETKPVEGPTTNTAG